MGCVANVGACIFPKQGEFIGKRVGVCFNYDTSDVVSGVVVRDDADAPGVMIIALDNGRVVLATECQWHLA